MNSRNGIRARFLTTALGGRQFHRELVNSLTFSIPRKTEASLGATVQKRPPKWLASKRKEKPRKSDRPLWESPAAPSGSSAG